MEIVCFGQQNWDYCWTAKQQIMTRLASRGHRVLYVDPTWSMKSGSRWDAVRALAPVSTGAGLRELDANLHLFTYQYAAALRWRRNESRWGDVVRGIAGKLGFRAPLAFALHPDAAPLIEALQPAARIYYAVDEMSAFGGTPPDEQQRLREAEEHLLRSADVALAVSPRLHERFAALNPRTFLLENGADFERFAPESLARAPRHPLVASLTGPRLGFVGQVDERLDQELLVTLARRRPQWQLVLAGRVKPGVSVARLEAEANVHVRGYQPYTALPGILRDIDVCLVPYEQSLLTHSCNPLKVYEYLATGKPVVSTPLDGLRICREVVSLASGAGGFLDAIEQALADPEAGRTARLKLAGAHTWDRRVDQLEEYLEHAAEAARDRGASLASTGAIVSPPTPSYFAGERLPCRSRLAHDALTAAGWVSYGARQVAGLLRGRREPIRRILVVRQTRLGDLVVFLPTLAALRRRFPEAHIVLGVQPGMRLGALLEGCDDIDEIRELDFLREGSPSMRSHSAARFFAEGFDLVVSGGGFFVMRDAFFSGAPHRVGLDDGHPLQVLNRTRVRLDPTRHEAENNLALIEALGGRAEGAERAPRLRLDPQRTRESAARVCEGLGVPPEAPVLAVHPGSQKPSRRWPIEGFAEVVRTLLSERPDLHVLFTGVPGEEDLIERIRTILPAALRGRAHSTLGLTDLHGLAGLLQRSATVLCNDTGVLHVARAVGAPLVALLGPENDRLWGPHPLGEAPATALRHVVPCAPCQRWSCEQHFCLRLLRVDEVLAEVRALLDGRGEQGTPERGRELIQLTRRIERHTWASLANAGIEVPLVSVILPAGLSDAGLTEALAAVDADDYPRIEVVAAAPARLPASRTPVRVIPAQPDAGAMWSDLVEESRGAFVATFQPGATWKPGRLGAAVSALMRDPQANGVDDRGNPLPIAPGSASAQPVGTFRRSALAAALAPADAVRTATLSKHHSPTGGEPCRDARRSV
ncbi:MAG: UDP-glycosyl transferase/glycogen phosphorylase [Armatimonadetes bacterium]|nr:UDP-glycosyl transferase/glycogen phosphorylase [Armatimonadota bacterium]